jgi:hypothetical protein
MLPHLGELNRSQNEKTQKDRNGLSNQLDVGESSPPYFLQIPQLAK